MLCTTAGVTCSGNSLVTCALDSMGCMVSTTVNCAIDDQVCDATLATPACVDACADIPAADRCTTVDARACTGETLEICTMNAEGCLVLDRTMCDDAAGGACDISGTMPMCVIPADPCAGVANACTTAGTSCSTDSLVTCAPNAFGCLVETTVDCTTGTAGACDDSGASAICTTTDVCPTPCTAGAACSGPNLVTCAADAFGCLVATPTDCTATAFGFCDAAATPAAMCSTAATDPCLGVTECGTAPARTCATDTLTVCSANAFGCFVGVDTDCTTDGNICDPTEPASCVAPSVCGDGVIEGSETCDDTNVVAGDGCSDVCVLEAGWVCTGSPTVCVPTCAPLAAARVLNCASGMVSGDTADGTTAVSEYECETFTYPSNEEVWAFTNEMATDVDVRIVATRGTSTRDADLYVLEADSTVSCGEAACADSSTGTSGTETVDFVATAGENFFVAYDIYNAPVATTDYTLTVTCTPRVCGDGTRAASEGCDDANVVAGDGCSATCTVEPLFTCTGTAPSVCTGTCPNGTVQAAAGETCDDNNSTPGDGCSATCAIEAGFACSGAPSVCVPLAANGTCGTATAVTANATFTDVPYLTGGPRTLGASCGGGGGNTTLFYAVTVPANSLVTVTTTGTLVRVLMTQNTCADATCATATDSAPETATIINATASPFTRVVSVRPYSSPGSGTVSIAFAYTTVVCGDGIRNGAETCDDGNATAGDGCSGACAIETGFACSGTPSVCVALAANATCARATAVTANATFANVPYLTGGPRTLGSGCGGGAGNTALFYSVTVPANSFVVVTTTGTLDRVLMTQNTCGDATCATSTDAVPETATITNATASPITRVVSLRPYFAAETGTNTLSIAFAYTTVVCGDGIRVAGSEICDDGNLATGDGCSSTCTVETNFTCNTASPTVCMAAPYIKTTIAAACVDMSAAPELTTPDDDDGVSTRAALPFALTFFGTAMSHFQVSTNGLFGVFPADSGSIGTLAANSTTVPSTTAPNGYIAPFWDDLDGMTISTLTTGTAGSRVFVIQWNGNIYDIVAPVRFQAQIRETTGVIEFHYCAASGSATRTSGSEATISLENAAGTVGIAHSINTGSSVTPGTTALRFTPNP